MTPLHSNQLIHESSPYLIQHARNPVEWHPWKEEVLDMARKEDKLMLVSIGYSACHWCHVMAHESFEDPEVAGFMNEHFVCIKVDREERPDVDHFFMTAVQLMGVQGGWPLNVVTLPDGQPFWGGTYFPKDQWLEVLIKITQLFRQERDKLTHHAHRLTLGIQQSSVITSEKDEIPDATSIINDALDAWSPQWDMNRGGSRGKPKFPMPVNLSFLLHLHYHHPRQAFEDFLQITLSHMSRGGIYDQIGGGFARYSVDEQWKVPHFEKMLYDNAQLIELYSHAYPVFGNEEYRQVVYETIGFVKRELMHPSGAFYSALDADSDGEEGKYYVWTDTELTDILGKEFPLFAGYYNINETGYWENGNYILIRTQNNADFAEKHSISLTELNQKIIYWKTKLFEHRKLRTRPGLDDKTIASWNALMTKALSEAYKIFGEEDFRALALQNGKFIAGEMMEDDGRLYRIWKDEKSSVKGFMEDYAGTISAFIRLYEISGNEQWIEQSVSLADYAISHFYDDETGHFMFMEKDQSDLPANHFETQDNVIPSANAVMGHALFDLSLFTGKTHYLRIAEKMLGSMLSRFRQYPWGYAHWGDLMLAVKKPRYEVVVAGPQSLKTIREMQKKYRPDVVWAPITDESENKISLVQDRKSGERTTIYICSGGTCQLPVHTIREAEKLLTG